MVRVHVASDPAGASVVLPDGTVVCDATPCSLDATTGETLVLRAKLGKRKGRVALTPTEDQTVLIELKAPQKPVARPQAQKAPERKRKPAARSSDLKVPEWAQ